MAEIGSPCICFTDELGVGWFVEVPRWLKTTEPLPSLELTSSLLLGLTYTQPKFLNDTVALHLRTLNFPAEVFLGLVSTSKYQRKAAEFLASSSLK